jgi:hypothetical protein
MIVVAAYRPLNRSHTTSQEPLVAAAINDNSGVLGHQLSSLQKYCVCSSMCSVLNAYQGSPICQGKQVQQQVARHLALTVLLHTHLHGGQLLHALLHHSSHCQPGVSVCARCEHQVQ